MLWSFSNKSSGPQFLSFNGSQTERAMIHFDSLPSSRFDIDESDSNNYPASQIASILERRGGLPCSATTSLPIHRSLRLGQNPLISSTPQHHAGVPAMTSVCLKSPFVATTDVRSDSKISAAPSGQLTIFYNGSVSVYDNISPEKAQAIMLLAGNEAPAAAPLTAPEPVTSRLTLAQPRCSHLESNSHDSGATKRYEVLDECRLMHSKGVFVVPTRQFSGAVSQCRGFIEKRRKI